MREIKQELIKTLDLYPCCVCIQKMCTAPDCPAANGHQDEYLKRLEALLDKEIRLIRRATQFFPPELEEVIDIREHVETGG